MAQPVNVAVRCPKCNWRVMDKVSPTTGKIEIKCPRCHKIVGGGSGSAPESAVSAQSRLASNITKEEVTTE